MTNIDAGTRGSGGGRAGIAVGLAAFCTCAIVVGESAEAADFREAERLFRTGRYEECARMAEEEVGGIVWSEPWIRLKIEAELAMGEDESALASLESGISRFSASLPLWMLARDVYRFNGRELDAEAVLDRIEHLIRARPGFYGAAEDRVAIGRFFLLRGADAKVVLDQFFEAAIDQDPEFVEAYLASAELALSKQDDALADETLRGAPKDAEDDPRSHYLMARAHADGDRARSAESLDRALAINPRHVDGLLLRADQLIDAEQYDEASRVLDRVIAINPREPRAWALRAVLAHLRNRPEGESESRRAALERWPANPEVDHLIGRTLSQKYRFAEGADAQRRSLGFDPDYLPAKVQLCQDLLRLGREEEGWELADEVFALDAYNVLAYNLVTLRDHLEGFRTLEGDGFQVRMDPLEADLYGDRVLELLGRARLVLGERYEAEVEEPIVVEIFPKNQDFAVRTFGLPGADGFLGVCFGRVITANSPASQGEDPANWESVLWHEYCHTVTLARSHNKMPRWLSEGISVFEEGRQNPGWSMPMSPTFRSKLLDDDLTPLSDLSGAFLAPETPLDLSFAYFESSLAVAYLVEQAGHDALNGLLDDLGAGLPINNALPGRFGLTLDELDEGFARFARAKAEAIAPDASFEEPDLPPVADAATLEGWLETHPGSIEGWRRLGLRLIAEEDWERAADALENLKTLYPEDLGADNPYVLLANAYRHLNQPDAERAVLEELVSRDLGAASALRRLMEIDEADEAWERLAEDARRLLAVNPLIPAPHRMLGMAAERLEGRVAEAIDAYRALALLDDTDPAGLHYRLASLLHREGRIDEARLEVLKALEEAPRYRDAHRLLLEIVEGNAPDSEPIEDPAEDGR